MTDKNSGFWATAWRKSRPQTLAAVIELAGYLRLWTLALVEHIARRVIAAAGVDPDIIAFVGWMEKWFFIASFGSFFWRLLVRTYETTRGQDL